MRQPRWPQCPMALARHAAAAWRLMISPSLAAGVAALSSLGTAACTKTEPAPAAAEPTIVSIAPQASALMPPKDSALVEAGRAVSRVMASSGDLWPGFAPEAILVYWPYAPFPAVLITSKAVPPEWRLVAAGDTDRAPAVHFREGALRGLVGNIAFGYRIGDLSATAVVLDATVAGTLNLAFHEAFHWFQRSAFANALRGDPDIPDSLVADAEFLAMQEVELPLLRAALDEPRRAQRADLLRRYLAVRRARLDRVDPAIEAAEVHWELIEGSSAWVGIKAASLYWPTARADVAHAVRTSELRDLLPRNQGGLAQRVVRARARGVGAALLVVLEDAGAPWQPVAESGRSLHDLLARASGPPPRSPDALVREARAAAGYDTLLAMTRSWVDTLSRSTLRKDFMARPGFRVVIDVEAEALPDGRVRFPTYNASGLARSPDPATTIYLPVESFSIDEPGLLVTARNAALMVERRAMEPFRLTLITGELAAFPRLRSFRPGDLALAGPTYEIRASRATVNKESDSLLHVVVRR